MEQILASCDTLECLLPSSIEVNKHHDSTFVNICKTLQQVVEEDIDMSTRKHILAVQNILRVVNFSLNDKFDMKTETRGRMVSLLLKLICRKEGNRRLQSSLMNICATLTQNKFQKSQLPKNYVVNGEELYALLEPHVEEKSVFERYAPEYSTQITNEYINTLHKLVRNVSKYFTKEFSMGILAQGQDLIASHASRITAKAHIGIGLIELFFNVDTNAKYLDTNFLDKIFAWLQYSETLFSTSWNACVLSILRKLIVKPKFRKNITSQHLKTFYGLVTNFVHSKSKLGHVSRYELSARAKTILSSRTSPWKNIAIFIVETIQCGVAEDGDKPLGMSLFRQLVRSIDTQFHPSTKVHFIMGGQFIREVSVAFANRVGVTLAERNATCYQNSEFVEKSGSDYRRGFEQLDKTKADFVALVLPLILNALYHRSHHYAESAMQTLSVLVQLGPQAVQAKLLPQIYRALDPEKSLSHAHQAVPALRALTYTFWHLSKTNLPEIAPHFHDIVSLTMPGIDSNDGMKTLHALNFFAMFFVCVPLIDCSGDDWTWERQNKDENAIYRDEDWLRVQSTSAFFEEFAVEFLNHMLRYAAKTGKENGQVDGGLSDDSGKASASDNYGVLGVSGNLCIRFFFCSMSPKIRKTVVVELAKQMLSVSNEMTMVYELLCKYAGRFEPTLFLELLIPTITARVFKNHLELGKSSAADATKGIFDDDVGNTSLLWYLKILNASCKHCGSACLQYSKFYIQMLSAVLHHESEKVRSAGGQLLRSLLNNLTSCFVVDENSFDQLSDSNNSNTKKTIQEVYARSSRRNGLKLKWHIATAEELAFVKVLTTSFLMKSLKSLEALLKAPFVKNKRTLDDWKHNLDILVSGLSGVASHEEISTPLKSKVSIFCCDALEYFGNDENSDPKVLKKLIQLSALGVASNSSGARGGSVTMKTYFFDALSKIVSDKSLSSYWSHVLKHSNNAEILKYDRPYPVFISILKAESRQQNRVSNRDEYNPNPRQSEGAKTIELVNMLILDATQHTYRDVRSEACIAIDGVLPRRAELCAECCKRLVDSLKKESTSNGQALGTLSVLMKKRILFSMRHDWNLLKEFYTAAISPDFIESLSEDKKLEAQTILSSIIVAMAEIKEKYVPGLDKASWEQFARDLIESKLLLEINDMRWWHTMVASTYLLLSMPKTAAESASVGLINSWFLKLVARQELPLRQLALSSFAFSKDRMKVLGTNEIDVRAILDAILQNHSDPRGSNVPRSIWTPGVRQLLSLAGAGYYNCRGSKYTTSWGSFKMGHALVVSNFQFGNNKDTRGAVLHYIDELVEKASAKGIEKKTCTTIGEIFAGCVRGTDTPANSKAVVELLQPAIERAVGLTPLSWIHTWLVSYVAIVEDPTCYEFVFDAIIHKLLSEFDASVGRHHIVNENERQSNPTDVGNSALHENGTPEETSFAGPSKWLNILTGLFCELAGYEDEITARRLTIYSMEKSIDLLLRGAKSTFESCRKFSSKCLAWICVLSKIHECKGVEDELLKQMRVNFVSEDATDQCVETACHLIAWLVRFGPIDFVQSYVAALLPATMRFQNASAAGGKNAEKVALARNTAKMAATALIFESSDCTVFKQVWDFLLEGFSHSSYHNRVAALAFLNNFYESNIHVFSVAQNEELIAIVKGCLNDRRPEVQEGAQTVLMMMLLYIDEVGQNALCEYFSAMASAKIPKNKEKFPNKVKKAYRKRAAGVLGLSAIVERNPYSVPKFVPDALVLMCRVASDPGSANGIIKRSLANFKRSHNDEWEQHKLAFTSAQLDWLQDFFLPNNYYA